MCWCISTLFHNETSGRDIVINWSRSPGFCQMELYFFPLWSKTGFSHYCFSVKSLWTFLHALKPFPLNQIIAFADGLTQYFHCYNYINPGQMQDPHNILLIVSTGSSPVTCWWNVASAGAHHTLPIPPLQHILRLFPDILMSVRSQPPFHAQICQQFMQTENLQLLAWVTHLSLPLNHLKIVSNRHLNLEAQNLSS